MTIPSPESRGFSQVSPDPDDMHALDPIRVRLYSMCVQCRCGFTTGVVPSSDRHLAWGQAVRHIVDAYGPEF